MKYRSTSAFLAGAAAVTICRHAHATFIGLLAISETPGPGSPPVGSTREIFHVYAQFTDPSDRVNFWGGGGTLGPGQIWADGSGAGFTNVGGPSGQLAPYSPGTARDYDCYMTIGVRYGMEAPGGVDGTMQFPGTPVFITNGATSWNAPDSGAGVFISNNNPQGRADYRVSGNDTDTRVLLMQLVVNAHDGVHGNIAVNWSVDGQPGSGGTVTNVLFLHEPTPPAPGGLALLACAGFFGTRRRRQI